MWEKQEKHRWTNKEWLDSGGAEIVLEVVRRIGWTVEVYDAEEWNFLDNIVSVGDRDNYRIEINGAMPPWQQAVAAVATADSHFRRFESYSACKFPFFYDGDMPGELEVGEINEFIDRVKFSSEIAIALMSEALAAGKEVVG